MLTLKQCKEILSKEADGLTDNEILEIRDWLSVFAEIIIESTDFSDLQIKKIRKKKTNERKSNCLHKSLNGRAEQRV
jgi:predicted house-cleaning noncanonical NTP pyrophosphatase (MazG superfamily)